MDRKLNYIYEELATLNKSILKMAKLATESEQRALDSIKELAATIQGMAEKSFSDLAVSIPDKIEVAGLEGIDKEIAKSFRKELEDIGPLTVKGEVLASTPEVTERLLELGKLVKELTTATEKIKLDLPETFQVTGYVKAKVEGFTITNPLPVILSNGSKAIDIEKLLIQVANAAAKSTTRVLAGGALGDTNDLGELKTDKASVAERILVSGSITYICHASPGSAYDRAVWRIKKIDATSATDTKITWANGRDNFENLATNLSVVAAHTYA